MAGNPNNPEKGKTPIPIKVPDEIMGGAYANNMMVSHSREEFVMDFVYVFPRQGIVNARVITSPAHMKRILRALADNVEKYERQYGNIAETSGDKSDDMVVN